MACKNVCQLCPRLVISQATHWWLATSAQSRPVAFARGAATFRMRRSVPRSGAGYFLFRQKVPKKRLSTYGAKDSLIYF